MSASKLADIRWKMALLVIAKCLEDVAVVVRDPIGKIASSATDVELDVMAVACSQGSNEGQPSRERTQHSEGGLLAQLKGVDLLPSFGHLSLVSCIIPQEPSPPFNQGRQEDSCIAMEARTMGAKLYSPATLLKLFMEDERIRRSSGDWNLDDPDSHVKVRLARLEGRVVLLEHLVKRDSLELVESDVRRCPACTVDTAVEEALRPVGPGELCDLFRGARRAARSVLEGEEASTRVADGRDITAVGGSGSLGGLGGLCGGGRRGGFLPLRGGRPGRRRRGRRRLGCSLDYGSAAD